MGHTLTSSYFSMTTVNVQRYCIKNGGFVSVIAVETLQPIFHMQAQKKFVHRERQHDVDVTCDMLGCAAGGRDR